MEFAIGTSNLKTLCIITRQGSLSWSTSKLPKCVSILVRGFRCGPILVLSITKPPKCSMEVIIKQSMFGRLELLPSKWSIGDYPLTTIIAAKPSKPSANNNLTTKLLISPRFFFILLKGVSKKILSKGWLQSRRCKLPSCWTSASRVLAVQELKKNR